MALGMVRIEVRDQGLLLGAFELGCGGSEDLALTITPSPQQQHALARQLQRLAQRLLYHQAEWLYIFRQGQQPHLIQKSRLEGQAGQSLCGRTSQLWQVTPAETIPIENLCQTCHARYHARQQAHQPVRTLATA